jgi:hypothetical protein
MNKTNLQIIITKDLEIRSKSVAGKLGFNNLQEMVRAMLVSAVDPKSDFLPFSRISPSKEKLYRNEIAQSEKDYYAGNAKSFSSAEEMVEDIEAE